MVVLNCQIWSLHVLAVKPFDHWKEDAVMMDPFNK